MDVFGASSHIYIYICLSVYLSIYLSISVSIYIQSVIIIVSGMDLFGASSQFRSWLGCRAPRCNFDILVVRYETLNQSVPTILDFLDVPHAARSFFPIVRLRICIDR